MGKTITDVKVVSHRVADDSVKARVLIGEGQKGAWAMLIGASHFAGGTAAKWVTLGKGAALRGKHLEVSAIVMDVRKETDRLTVTVEISGPQTTRTVVSAVGKPGDNAAYSIIIRFN